jgi:aminoglycoside phosphotransferase
MVDKASIFLLRKPHDKKIVKIIPYRRKTNVENEVRLLRYTASLNLSPSVYSVTYHTNYTYVVMDHVQGSNLADIHGRIILNNTWFITNLKETHAEVCKILRFLANHGIVYPDRSAWQFIRVADGRLVLLDMEHAEKSTKEAAHAELQLIDTVPWNPLFV